VSTDYDKTKKLYVISGVEDESVRTHACSERNGADVTVTSTERGGVRAPFVCPLCGQTS
jgi:hypothetical protein